MSLSVAIRSSSSKEGLIWTVSICLIISLLNIDHDLTFILFNAVFKFYTYKVPRMQVEACLTALPYILEGYVLPVADPHCDTRVASLVRLREGAGKVNLERIRSDLENELPAYQLPTVLRVLKQHEEVPRTWSDKLAMKKVVQKFFPQDSNDRLYDEATEVLDVSEFMRAKTSKLWDLSGMRQ